MKPKNCKNCKLASFDAMWGEYFCRFWHRIMHNVNHIDDCPDYKEGEPNVSRKDYSTDD